MGMFQSLLLGIVQGLTEFLPVSSSGHIVLMDKLLGIRPDIAFVVLLHLATLTAVVIYFWRAIWDLAAGFLSSLWKILTFRLSPTAAYYSNTQFKTALLLLLGTVVTAAIGLPFKDKFEALFSSVLAVGIALIITGLLIVLAERVGKGNRFEAQMNFVDALVIGLFQGFAIAPGLSRSGATISASLGLSLKRDFAAKFSFLLSVPAILAATLVERKELLRIIHTQTGMINILAGFAAAFITGILAIKIVMSMISRMSLRIFAYYCFAVGTISIVLALR